MKAIPSVLNVVRNCCLNRLFGGVLTMGRIQNEIVKVAKEFWRKLEDPRLPYLGWDATLDAPPTYVMPGILL